MWRFEIVTLLRNEFKKGNLILPYHLKHIKSYSSFYSWTVQFYNQTWAVHLKKPSNTLRHNVEYLGKYLKRPPMSETRIKAYNRHSVTFCYLDHYDKSTKTITLPVLEFIDRLIAHIPDYNFRNIRYYGFLATAVRSKLLPLVYSFLKTTHIFKNKVYTPWRTFIQLSFKRDPLKCPHCGQIMEFFKRFSSIPFSFLSIHKEIANGFFQRL